MATNVLLGVFDLDAHSPADLLLLSTDERQRAQRFCAELLRRRYIAGRAAVRRTLGAITRQDPADLVFSYGEHGRPDLVGHGDISFNFSHSNEVGVLALCRGARVGVDVETVRADFADLRVADRFFAPAEAARLRALPTPDRSLAFLRCWTRKEALLKAVGAGLTLPLRTFEVSFESDQPARILAGGQVLGAGGWQLRDVSGGSGRYVAAVAVETADTVDIVSQDRGMPPPAE